MSVLLISILLFVIVLALVLFRQHRKFHAANLPPAVAGLPYIGVGLQFAAHPLQYATQQYKKHGEIFTLQLFGKRCTFLVGADAHEPFFGKGDKELSQEEPYRFSVPIFGERVVYDAPLPIRTQQLKLLRTCLSTEALRSYVDKIIQETEDFFKNWKDEGTADLRIALSELIILTASNCLMGTEIRLTLFKEIAHLFQILDEGLTPISVFWPYLPIPAHRRRDQAREEMVKLYSKIIKQRNAQPDVKHNDVLQMFMDATYRDGEKYSDREITGMMIALLFAGQHTSSVTSTWTGLLLLANKDKYMGKVLEEQTRLLSKTNGKLNYDIIGEMDYLKNCIKEALRMYPPLIFVMRSVEKGFQYKNCYVPKGDTLFVSPALSHRLPEVFKNPDTYDPERFGKGREEDFKFKYGWLGFGAGRHACLGEQFAYLQIKTIWSVLLRDFDLELVGSLPVPDYKAMVVGPKGPCLIRYKRKQQSK